MLTRAALLAAVLALLPGPARAAAPLLPTEDRLEPSDRLRYAMEAPRVDRNWCCCWCRGAFNVTAAAFGECDSALCREEFPNECGGARVRWAGETGIGGTPTTGPASVLARCAARLARTTLALEQAVAGGGFARPPDAAEYQNMRAPTP